MAKTNIVFNGTDYFIDDASLSAAVAELKSHLSTTMGGTGAVINLGGIAYNVDATKLSDATNVFTSYLNTIKGNGHKVVIGGVEYGIDSTKVAGAVSELNTAFGNLASGGGSVEMLSGNGQTFHSMAPSALTFRSSADINDFSEVKINGVTLDPANYTKSEGSTIITLSIDYLKTLAAGDYTIDIVSETGSPSADFDVVIPETNEHGFYYNQPYSTYVPALGCNSTFIFREDGTMVAFAITETATNAETGTFTSSGNSVTATISLGTFNGTVSSDGTEITVSTLGVTYSLGNEAIVADEDFIYIYDSSLGGYTVNPIDKTKASYGVMQSNINNIPVVKILDFAFEYNSNLSSIVISDNVETIGYSAFEGCTNLSSFIISNSVKIIDALAFENCTGLTSVIIGDSVTNINWRAFNGCSNLSDVYYAGSEEDWGKISIEGSNEYLTNAEIHYNSTGN